VEEFYDALCDGDDDDSAVAQCMNAFNILFEEVIGDDSLTEYLKDSLCDDGSYSYSYSYPFFTPNMVPVPAPTMVPVPAPTMVPVPAPTMVPVPVPSLISAPVISPVPAPTPQPQGEEYSYGYNDEKYFDLPFCDDGFFDLMDSTMVTAGASDYDAEQTVNVLKVYCSCELLPDLSSSITLYDALADLSEQSDLCVDSVNEADLIQTVTLPSEVYDCTSDISLASYENAFCDETDVTAETQNCVDGVESLMEQVIGESIMQTVKDEVCGTSPAPSMATQSITTPAPSMNPTSTDTASVYVELSVTATVETPTASDLSGIKQSIENATGIGQVVVKNLAVTSVANSRRLSSSVHRRLTTYTWTVSCDIEADLSNVGAASNVDFASTVETNLDQTTLSTLLLASVPSFSSLESISTSLNTRQPTPAPSLPPNKQRKKSNPNKSSANLLMIILFTIGGVIVVIIGCVIYQKRKQDSEIDGMNKNIDDAEEEVDKQRGSKFEGTNDIQISAEHAKSNTGENDKKNILINVESVSPNIENKNVPKAPVSTSPRLEKKVVL
jgi:hypothetical protein